MSKPGLPPVGIGGHGLLLAPHSPCQFAWEPGDLFWVRSKDGSGSIAPGDRPAAAGRPTFLPGAPSPTWEYGTDGPQVAILIGKALDDVFARIDAGLASAPWCVLGPGFLVHFPPGFIGFSPTTADDPFFELHLREDTSFRHGRTIADAFIQFRRAPVPAASVRVTGPYDIETLVLDTKGGPIRVSQYEYVEAGETWRKCHYALPLDASTTIMMTAQAPLAHAERMFEGADFVAGTFAPLR
jgi:hypothetical protein